MCSVGRSRFQVEILDQHYFVALFVVDKFIDEPLRYENAEPARSHTVRVTIFEVAQWIFRWIRNRGVGNFIQREAFPRI